ncbi:MAG: M23 family metallopeptidase [Thermanaerothrix sp.]|nr:M23 family metallopeptidase [Thermanaerothrix sp.]
MINDLLPLLLQRLLQPSSTGESPPSEVGDRGEFAQILQAWLLTSLSTSTASNSPDLSAIPVWGTLLEMVIRQNVASSEEESFGFAGGGDVFPTQPWPVQGRLTQEFHARHRGVDIGVPVGTPVRTTISGRVIYAGWNNQGYGNLVIVENGPWRTYYAHLSEIPVRVGQWVEAGEVIGLSGNTGNSTGPHVHYEVRREGTPVHPDELLAYDLKT